MLPPDAKGVRAAIKAAPIAPVANEETGLLQLLPDFQQAQVSNPMIDVKYRGQHNKAINYRMAGNIFRRCPTREHFNSARSRR